jgi:hypothetical protein
VKQDQAEVAKLPELQGIFSYPQNVWITLWTARSTRSAFSTIAALMTVWLNFEQGIFPCLLNGLHDES